MKATPTTSPTAAPATGLMHHRTSAALADPPVPVRLRLALLWIAMLLVFAYVDMFGFFRADLLEAALAARSRERGSRSGRASWSVRSATSCLPS